MLGGAQKSTAVSVIVRACQLAILIIGSLWLFHGAMPDAGVALVALVLIEISTRYPSDKHLRQLNCVITSALLAAHIVLGMFVGLYETSLVYDKMMHLIGSAAIAAIVLLALQKFCRRHHLILPSALFLTLVFSATLSAGTLWEIFEFGVDQSGLFTAQRGLTDTMIDLIADAGGAALMLGLFAAARSRFETGESQC